MLTYIKHSTGVFTDLRNFRRKVSHWWMSMSDEQQKSLRARGFAVATCAIAIGVGLPSLSVNYEFHRETAEQTDTARRFAVAESVRDGIDPIAVSPLIDHPWMVSVEYALERDPHDALSRYGNRYRDAAALERVSSFEIRHIDGAAKMMAEQKCLAEAVYYESRSEDAWGQLAVAEVVMNRVADHRYPDTVCGVVYQGSERTTGCQFSFTCDGSMDEAPRGESWRKSQIVATNVLLGFNDPITGNATHYHADYVDPVWNSSLIQTTQFGTHIFYRFPRGAEWQMVRDRQAARVDGVMESVRAERAVIAADDAKPRSPQAIKPVTAAPAP